MSKTFLITSHTEGGSPFEQKTILYGLIKSLKRYFPDCLVLVASRSEVEYDSVKLADYTIIDKVAHDHPHGQGELTLLKTAVSTLKQLGRSDCIKLCYDFVIDDTNYQVFDQWLAHEKDFVSCWWRWDGLGIGTWVWYSKIDFLEKLIDFDQLNMYFEWKIYESVQKHNAIDRCYLYEDSDQMFNGDWYSRCDLVHDGGRRLKYNYGQTVALVRLDDANVDQTGVSLQSLALQTKLPAHVLLIDKRSTKIDLRTLPVYQKLFELLSSKSVSWSLIVADRDSQLFDYLNSFDYAWAWMLPDDLISIDALKNYHRQIILNMNVGCVSDANGVFFKNKILENAEFHSTIEQYIVDKFAETSYNNFVL